MFLFSYLGIGVCLLVQELVEFEHVVAEDGVVKSGALALAVDALKLRVEGDGLAAGVRGVELLRELPPPGAVLPHRAWHLRDRVGGLERVVLVLRRSLVMSSLVRH